MLEASNTASKRRDECERMFAEAAQNTLKDKQILKEFLYQF